MTRGIVDEGGLAGLVRVEREVAACKIDETLYLYTPPLKVILMIVTSLLYIQLCELEF